MTLDAAGRPLFVYGDDAKRTKGAKAGVKERQYMPDDVQCGLRTILAAFQQRDVHSWRQTEHNWRNLLAERR